MAELLMGWAAIPPVGGHRCDAHVDDLQPRSAKGVLKAADIRHDDIEPLAKATRHVLEARRTHLSQCRSISVRAVPLHIDDKQRRRPRPYLRLRKRRPPGDVWIGFARRDHE